MANRAPQPHRQPDFPGPKQPPPPGAIKKAEPDAAALTLRDYVLSTAVKARLADVARDFLPPAEIARCVLLAASRNPKLADCTQASLLKCMMESAQMGVAPSGTLGRGYLIPRWNSKARVLEATFDPGWRGLCDVARRSKVVRKIGAKVVREGDHFRRFEGTDPRIEHEPDAAEMGSIIGAYAVAWLPDGETQFEYLSRYDLEKIRAKSESKNDNGDPIGPWADWPEEMSRKSAVRRLCKYLPVSPELEHALEVATAAEMPPAEIPTLEAVEAKPRAQQMAERIRAAAARDEHVTEPEQPAESEPDQGGADDSASG